MTATRSTAQAQRALAVASAVRVFARSGYHATPVAAVATEAGISPAYVFRLFDGKLGLFVAALDHCYSLVARALHEGAEQAADPSPAGVLDAMGGAYAQLISDRDLLMLQVHAQSSCDVPEIRDAVRRGLALVTQTATDLSGADPDAVQRFLAYGQLCHLIVTTDLHDLPHAWASTLTHGIRHP
jgi:AcrR family transcriptional regulator